MSSARTCSVVTIDFELFWAVAHVDIVQVAIIKIANKRRRKGKVKVIALWEWGGLAKFR